MAGGRPSDYEPRFAQIAHELLFEGASLHEVGWHLRRSMQTIYEWMEKFPEFGEAVKTGRDGSKGWWEREGRLALRDKEFNSTLWYMNMKNRHGYRDKTEESHSVTVNETNDKVESAKDAYQKPY